MRINRIIAVALSTATKLISPVYCQQRRVEDDKSRELKVLKRRPWPWPQGCVEPNAFFNTNVIVTFEGDARNLDASIFMDLEDSFADAYNELRKDFCDDEFRKVVDVEIDQASLDIKEDNEFSLLFQVQGGCDGCSSLGTTLFSMEEMRRRELEVYKRQDHAMINGGGMPTSGPTLRPTSSPTSRPTSSPISNASPRDDDIGEDCCPTNGEQRAPYGSEFAAVYNSTFMAIGVDNRELQDMPVKVILRAVEVVSISCDDPIEEFETSVFVEVGGVSGDLTSALESEIFELESSFLKSYNRFGEEEICDPFFREVTEVKAEFETFEERVLDEHGERKLRKARFNYVVKGKCRACGSLNKRLFPQGSSGRARRLGSRHNRQLQIVFENGSCFCAVGAEERGVFEDEFTVAYNDDIQELRDEGKVGTVETVEFVEEDPPFTWAPTDSPTNYPTGPTDSPVPSPSPSRVPSAGPTETG